MTLILRTGSSRSFSAEQGRGNDTIDQIGTTYHGRCIVLAKLAGRLISMTPQEPQEMEICREKEAQKIPALSPIQ